MEKSPTTVILEPLADTVDVMTSEIAAYTIRDASPGDIGELVRMLEALQQFLAELDPIGRVRCAPGFGTHAYADLAAAVAEQHGRVFVLVDGDGRLAGFTAGFMCRQQTDIDLLDVVANRQGYLAKVFLYPHVRDRGWGRQLVEHIEAHLRKQGCDNMWVEVNAFNPALDFYTRAGYEAREIGMLKPL